MIIGVLEHGEIRIFDGIDHVMREWGPYPTDVQSGVITFYDADGTWLEPAVSNQLLHLQRNENPGTTVDQIGVALFEATTLLPNPHVTSLDELRARYPFAN
jgi:hypothetical protein